MEEGMGKQLNRQIYKSPRLGFNSYRGLVATFYLVKSDRP